MNERIDVTAAFDPELRTAQAELDAYVLGRPAREGVVTNADHPVDVASADSSEVAAIAESPEDTVAHSVGAVATNVITEADITKSFEKPVVPLWKQSKPDRLGMLLNDAKDHFEPVQPPYAAEYSGPEVAQLLDKFLPDVAIKAFRRLGKYYDSKKEGQVFRRVDHVGLVEKKTFHPHYYFLDRSRPGVTRMYFVDPEHKIAKTNRVRPSVANLVGIEVPDQEDQESRVAVLRFRVPKYDPKQKLEGLGPEDLRSVIEAVLDTNGELPDRLTGENERQMLFMMTVNGDSSRVQSTRSTKKQIEAFAKGEEGSLEFRGRVRAQAYVVNKLIKLFNQTSEARKVA